ncbi:MAG: hypothetical protein MJ025_01330 [Victivallaceae bacterium]|nr:hypothetical protein [Victivallaceae bacterium]
MMKSILLVSRGMWEPIGVVFAISLVWSLIRMIFCGEWRNIVRWCYFLGALGAFVWRLAIGIGGTRYHNVFLFIALFGIIDLFVSFPLPRLWKRLLFFSGLLCCLVHSVIYHPEDRQLLRLYEMVARDAASRSRVLGLAYDGKGVRHQYYSTIPVVMADRSQPLAELLYGLKGNLGVYDGNYDAVYLFDVVTRDEVAHLPEFEKLMAPGQVTQLGFVWLNRYHKRALVVCRYLPAKNKKCFSSGVLVENGDFSKEATPEMRQRILNSHGRRMPRLQKENFNPPAGWRFYTSLAGRNNAYFSRVKCQDGYALRLESDGYLCAITPSLMISEGGRLSFLVKAETDALLQVSRTCGPGLFPVVMLPLEAGRSERYDIALPDCPGVERGEVLFWLTRGVVELRDVRMDRQ